MRPDHHKHALLVLTLAFAGCRGDSTGTLPSEPRLGLLASRHAADDPPRFSDWSTPVVLDPPINTTSVDQGASLSRDGLTLYFHSDRPGGFGSFDIWVSHRASVNDPWGPAQNAGPVINTASGETAPTLSVDGHRLYFTSARPGGFGATDLYVSRRRNTRDDTGWEQPVNLGPNINSSAGDNATTFFEDEATGVTTMYFTSTRPGLGGDDIYASTLREDGTFSPAVLVPGINTAAIERQPSVRRDGLELYFASDRPGGQGDLDLWVATRASTADAWSPPVNLGAALNTNLIDARPVLSFDGTTLYFQSTRPGGLGPCDTPMGPCVFDLWVTTRTRLDDAGDHDQRTTARRHGRKER